MHRHVGRRHTLLERPQTRVFDIDIQGAVQVATATVVGIAITDHDGRTAQRDTLSKARALCSGHQLDGLAPYASGTRKDICRAIPNARCADDRDVAFDRHGVPESSARVDVAGIDLLRFRPHSSDALEEVR